jgi:hypothetical protein
MSKKTPISRRRFLGGVGAAALATGAPTIFVRAARASHQSSSSSRFVPIREDRFGRMFPNLPPFFKENTPGLRAALQRVGMLGGILDAKDNLGDNNPVPRNGEQAAINLIALPALSVNNPNNPGAIPGAPAQTAGSTFIGQFIDHDLTFDQTSRLGIETQPAVSPNTRDPRFDLDSVYGDGPDENPELYERESRFGRSKPTKLRIESGGLFEDVPRNPNTMAAIIADPRNDENMMISGLQAAFIKFHNNAVDLVRQQDRRADSEEVFERARRLTRWHYQWIVVHEFLPQFVGEATANDILRNGTRFYRPRDPFIPVEFQGAAYRMGHTLVRPSYRANLGGDDPNSPGGAAFFGMIFVPDDELKNASDPEDLRGGARAPRRFIGWQTFFDFGPTFTDGPNNPNPAIRPNKRVDAIVSTALLKLPVGTIAGAAPNEPILSLASRNLLRGITWSLPSGQSIAREIGAKVLTGDNDPFLKQLRSFDTHKEDFNLDKSTPLWVYVLNEGLALGDGGRHLGPVGGRIVGEVFVGLLEADQSSYFNADRRWKPTLPQRSGQVTGDFKMIDFLTFAGVAPDQRGQ